ncbi:MAG TPA: hypothetical protein VL099_12325 [Candidatus Binatia bacterium]|nr:hypothetical protein [Candidatus Binatia bacterium]
MKHIAMEDWIDFVNETDSDAKRQAIRRHLDGGCARCAKSLALWKRVRQAAAAEKQYQPDAATLRTAKAAFAAANLGAARRAKRGVAELLFDSFLRPAAEGARAAGGGARQVLYRSEPFQIDVQIEGTPHSNRLVITGQLLDTSREEKVARRVPLMLSNTRGIMVRMVTNEFGEFAGVIEDSGDLELSFIGRNEKPVVIALRETPAKKREGARCN